MTLLSQHIASSHAKTDGSDLRQITFSPDDNLATTVLKDGRLLTVKQQLLPVQGDPMLAVMRPDGTKSRYVLYWPAEK